MSIAEYIKNDTQEGWIEYIIQSLNGTIGSLEEYEEEYTKKGYSWEELLIELDQQIFNCTGCGWWCDISEENIQDEEQVCEDCFED